MASSQDISWLLVRGLSRETRHWADFPEHLRKSFPNSTVHVLELPGVGKKFKSPSPARIEDFVEDLRNDFQKIKELHPHKRWGLICVSLGGMIGLSWSNSYPGDFESLVIINSSGANLSWPWQRLSPKALKKIAKLFFRNDLHEREKTILELTTHMTPLTQELVEKWASYAKEYPLKREVFLKQIYAASVFKVPESLHPKPLFLVGAKDELTDPACSKSLAQHFNAQLETHPNAGHDLPLEDPAWLCEKIKKWTQT